MTFQPDIATDNVKTHLYILSCNNPDQFEQLLVSSFEKADKHFLNAKKYLINNSTDRMTDDKYNMLCDKYRFEQIKKNNIDICNARKLVTTLFDRSDADYYIFFENDMLMNEENNEFCSSGCRNEH